MPAVSVYNVFITINVIIRRSIQKRTVKMLKDKIDKILLQLEVQKPARYIGGELGSVIKDKSAVDVRFAFCFPDTYDVGMSHLGMKILYSLTNARENYWCERVFAPWLDMEKAMRKEGIPLYALESLDPVADFDIVGFTLQYELSFTNVLNMLDLAGIPLFSSERTALTPLIIAGGPCVCNPEPLADFIDIFVLGEGEEVNLELIDLYAKAKREGWGKDAFLHKAVEIEGIYVPAFYNVTYKDDGTIAAVLPVDNAPARVKKRIIADFDKVFYPDSFVVPFTETVHDRAVVEVLRGCIRGCRFCQAGFIYRPFREKTTDTISQEVKSLCESTGYEEVSLSSLSTSDYSDIEGLLTQLTDYTDEEHINLSLPSLRIDNFSKEVLDKIKSVRKSGLTFAPEAGTQRLRDVINKNVSEEEIMTSCKIAFEGGYTNVKLYFMLGLPTETLEDIEGIGKLSERIIELFYSMPNRPKGKGITISVSASTFVPKPFTPFEFEPQDTMETILAKQRHLVQTLPSRKISCSWHSVKVSVLEAVLARGDRRLCKVIYEAWKSGCVFDSWDACYRFEKWEEAFAKCDIDMPFYANRQRPYDEIMPWDHLNYLVSKQFLIRENMAAHHNVTTPNCRQQCAGCGVSKEIGGCCFG